jgi:DNA-directed RNA polymerase specialized sigma24 family protein
MTTHHEHHLPTPGTQQVSQRGIHDRVVASLDQEWARLVRSPRVLSTVNGWQLSDTSFSSLDHLLVSVGFRGATCDSQADLLLSRLVRHALHDPLAARIVLQRVLPPMISIASRRGKQHRMGFETAFGIVLSHAWEVIRTYPIERRPAKIASNIVRDIEYFAFSQSQRRHRNRQMVALDAETLVTPDSTNDTCGFGSARTTTHPEEELEQLLRYGEERRVSDRSLRVLRGLRDHSLEEFAARNDITPRTARVWRQQAANELRARTQCAG